MVELRRIEVPALDLADQRVREAIGSPLVRFERRRLYLDTPRHVVGSLIRPACGLWQFCPTPQEQLGA
jgi:hypothetical protein